MKTAVIMGVGPERGVGGQLCLRFAAEGLHVIAAGRTQASLDAIVETITAEGGSAEACVADATIEGDVIRLFDRAGDNLDVAVYNAGNNTPGRISEMEASYFEMAWRVVCFGGFLFGRETVRRLEAANKGGTLLFTGASASLRGRPSFGAFNSAKGALRNLAQAMAKEYGAQGIHVGHIVIDGPVAGDKIIKRWPERAAEMGEDRMISIEGIVDAYVYLYRQPRRAWTFEVDVRTSLETW